MLKKTNPVKMLRLLSLVTLLLLPLAQLLTNHSGPAPVAGAVSVAVSILLCIPPDREDARKSTTLLLTVSILAAILEILLDIEAIPPGARLHSYALVSAATLLSMHVSRVMRMMKSVDYLSARLTGWEVLAENVRMLYCLAFLMFEILLLSPAGGHSRLFYIAAASLFLLLYLILMVRGIIESHTIKDTRKANLRRLVRDNIVLRPDNPDRINVNYRMMYKRLCEYMEDKRPFLDDKYSMDDMAQALYTNKTYLSKLINTCVHMNFNQFINNYRVRYSMELFKKDNKLKVSELAELSGFHSTVTYTLAFKLFLGMPPGEWCNLWKEGAKDKRLLSMVKEAEL